MFEKNHFRTMMDRLLDPESGASERLHADLHGYYWKEWKQALKAYLADPKYPYNAICFLELHPANQRLVWGSPNGWFHENVNWSFVKVDPHTKRIESKKNPNWKKNGKGKHPADKKRNTETNVWVEWGPHMEHKENPQHTGPDGIPSHDPRVDTGGRTFEEAMVNLAHNVWILYRGNSDIPDDAKINKKDRW